jgi:8-oxo-dGTP pyrophosphatase MutT (NUDIX family)
VNISREHIKKALEKTLPGSESHRKMIPPNRDLHAPEKEKSKLKKSSVLLLLFEEKEELKICLIKRPAHMKHHASQVAFPGGQVEKRETALQTAFRETEEEIGVTSDKIEILGSLSELYVGVSGFLIHPFVGWLHAEPTFVTCDDEVEKTILFPLLKYQNKIELTGLETVAGRLTVPAVHFEGETIWGATLMILSEFYDVLAEL